MNEKAFVVFCSERNCEIKYIRQYMKMNRKQYYKDEDAESVLQYEKRIKEIINVIPTN